MAIESGSRLGPYEIVSLLGSGGMGEVYKAKDLKLGRTVAIKILQKELASDPERLKRFEQEARAASALDHPNIVTIHDISEVDGQHFIVMQYVEGKTLRELIGKLKLSKTLHYAIQTADGLARAHSQGIVHRDLKPDNVMVTEDGLIKILDFGLAKLTEPSDWTEASTKDLAQPHTKEGHIVGTAPYMSPEQAQGQKVDARSDIFSFGSMLYEMVTGRRAFTENSMAGLLAAIIRDEPNRVSDILPSVPLDLEKVIHRALRKESERRFQSIADVRVELQEIKEELDSGSFVSAAQLKTAGKKRLGNTWARATAIVLAAVIGVGIWHYFFPSELDLPPPKTVPLTSFEGLERDPALSPDGNQVAFTWNGSGDRFSHLYVHLIGGGDPLQLTSASADDFSPTWSPDGREITFLRETEGGHEILSIPAMGGTERRLTTTTAFSSGVVAHEIVHGLDWSPDSRFLAIADRESDKNPAGIFLLSAGSGEKQRFTTPPGGGFFDSHPVFSPDGQRVAFLRTNIGGPTDIFVQPLNGSEEERLTFDGVDIWDLDWTLDGRALVFSSDREGGLRYRLWKVWLAGGELSPLSIGENARHVSVAKTGQRMVYSQWLEDTNIVRVSGPSSATQITPAVLIGSTRTEQAPTYSPDGTRIGFFSERSGGMNLWVCDSDGTNLVQLTSGPWEFAARWSPSGRHIAFASWIQDKGSAIYVVDAKGGFPRNLTEQKEQGDGCPSWSADGRWIYFNSRRGGEYQIWRIPVEEGPAAQITQNGGYIPLADDKGQFVYYVKQDPSEGLWRVPVEGGEEEKILAGPVGNWEWTLWRHNIVYINQQAESGPTIEMLDLTTKKTTSLVSLDPQTQTSMGIAVSPDGQTILYTQLDVESDLMLIENLI